VATREEIASGNAEWEIIGAPDPRRRSARAWYFTPSRVTPYIEAMRMSDASEWGRRAQLVSSRAMMDAGSPNPPDNTEPLWDQARSNIERKQQLPPKEQRFLEQASNQASAVSTPERLAALLDRIAEAKARSTTEGR